MQTPGPLRVRVVAPAFPPDPQTLERGVARLTAAGLHVITDPQCTTRCGIFAGDTRNRASALTGALDDPAVDVIWAARGGYGCTVLLPRLHAHQPPRASQRARWLVGFSDLTGLFSLAAERWNLRILHAPMPGSTDFHRVSDAQLAATLALLHGGPPVPAVDGAPLHHLAGPRRDAAGLLVGGNLTTLNQTTGTPFATGFRDRLLVLEDVGEPPRKIHAALLQMHLAGRLNGAAGIILGTFTDCNDGQPATEAQLHDATAEFAAHHDLPVWSGLPIGHATDAQWPLPLHTPACITDDHLRLT